MKALIKMMKSGALGFFKLLWYLRIKTLRPACRLCSNSTEPMDGYGRIFLRCQNCGFIFTGDYPALFSSRGMGMIGSWGGPDSGGEREDYLFRMLHDDLNKKTMLLFGVGSNNSFPTLKKEGFDVDGCDVSQSVIRYRQNAFGTDSFFHSKRLSERKHRYDAVIACEVVQYFHDPAKWLGIMLYSLKARGILCGITNFHPGGKIEDDQEIGYMSSKGHVAYWSEKSLAWFLGSHGLKLVTFEMICPGSVKPDPEYNDLYPNKRVFFASTDREVLEYLEALKARSPILPIDMSMGNPTSPAIVAHPVS